MVVGFNPRLQFSEDSMAVVVGDAYLAVIDPLFNPSPVRNRLNR